MLNRANAVPGYLFRAHLERAPGFVLDAASAVVGRIFVHAAPVGTPWMWTLIFGQHEDRKPTHGYAATREAAMRAFAKSWRRE